jgi:AraC-like DNA-binding protein
LKIQKKSGEYKFFTNILVDGDSFLAIRDNAVLQAKEQSMDSIIDMLFPYIFKCGFSEKGKPAGDGPMGFALKRSYGEGAYLLKPIGKSLMVSVTDLNYRRSFELAWEQPEYFHISLWRGNIQGIFGQIGKNDVYHQNIPVGFRHCQMGVSFLPGFFDALLGLRHGISQDELARAIDALNRFPPPPEVAVVLKQMGDAACYNRAGNAWFEAKTLELISLALDWHRQFETKTPFRLRKQDQEGITEALRYAEKHLADPLSLETLAKLAAMSMSKFTATFKIHTGLSTACYIHRLRMERAIDLLKNTSEPLGEIAAAVGYKYHASFSAAFREQFGIVPSVFRRRNIKEGIYET